MIKGITVKLINLVDSGQSDPFGNPIMQETSINVENVLIQPGTSDDITDSINLYGRKAVYNLAIPKGDDHIWENQIVEFFGERFKVFGKPLMGIEANIPLKWNMKVQVERYD